MIGEEPSQQANSLAKNELLKPRAAEATIN